MAEAITLKAIRKADPSWQKRIRSEMHDIQLDYDADILYLTFGAPTESVSVPLNITGEDAYLRVQPETLKIVGVDILHFRKGFLQRKPDAKQAFQSLFDLLGDMDWRIQLRLPTPDASGNVQLMLPAASAPLSYFPTYLPKAAPDLVAAERTPLPLCSLAQPVQRYSR